jgi:SAM-dependent methyltransferase
MTEFKKSSSLFAISYRKAIAHYLNLIIPKEASLLEIGCGSGVLLNMLHGRRKMGIDAHEELITQATLNRGSQNAEVTFFHAHGEDFVPSSSPDYVVLSDVLNHTEDVQALLEKIHSYAQPSTRLVLHCYNTLWRPLLVLATWLGIRACQPPGNWLSRHDLKNLLELSGWEIIRHEARILSPIEIPLLSSFLNRWVAPLLPYCCLALIFIARPRSTFSENSKSVSIIIPARNESGNIAAAIARTPMMGSWMEFIFVEGNSTDDTWEAIQHIQQAHPELRIKIAQQPGRGKGDAVRTGYAMAEGDILMILDADLTMPPEDLPKFYCAVARGTAEFANGSRLVYPMEKKAMQFLNLCANKFFGIAFSWLLGQHVKDTLCGTKVLTKENYLKIAANRSYFGNFDPFGDFDLLFGASKLNLNIRDIPVRYRERTYGVTNISRWSHGMLLCRMLLFAAKKLKFV